MISLHPTQQQLLEFVEGNSTSAMSLVISAHVDMCPQCRANVDELQEKVSEELFSQASEVPEFAEMLANITQMPQADRVVPKPVQSTIELDGRHFQLPRALSRYASKTGNWSRLIGNLWQAPVDLGPIGKANFIFMEKGGRVPEHTHKGSELTLVIDGEFSDELANYDSGDFILMDSNHIHAPHSESEEGCLVFSIVDKPLHFTSGLARLLNPFSQLFF